MDDKPIIALTGATASGKSALAATLAKKINGEIISVDAGAVYRGLDIGTAKPSAELQKEIPHHLLDICNPDETFDVGQFVALAQKTVAEIKSRGKVPILAGGTMMYFNALRKGLHNIPAVPESVRRQVREKLKQEGAAALYEELSTADAAAAKRIHRNDAQRIGRALEVFYASGKPLSFFLDGEQIAPTPLAAILLIPQNRKLLREKIGERSGKMLKAGWVRETRKIINENDGNPPALYLIGYRQIAAHLRGNYDKKEMKQKIIAATCRLAKRQITWMRAWKNPLLAADPFCENTADAITEKIRGIL